MKKATTIIIVIAGVLCVSAYIFLRQKLRTPGFQSPAAPTAAAATEPPKSALDLRPRLVTKLQELVSKGSGGLYRLSIREVEPDILASTISLKNIRLTPDTAVLHQLQAAHRQPADVFSFALDSLRIEGLGIKDLLEKDVIDLKSILVLAPTIEIFHQRPEKGGKPEDQTLYQRLRQQLRHLGIGQLTVRRGTVIVHQYAKKKAARFEDVEASLSDILMDSTTQNDRERFLFAKTAELSTRNINWRTADGLYDTHIAKATLVATSNRLSISGMEMKPLYGKDEFQNHIKVMTERFALKVPALELHGVDWWSLLNQDRLEATSADLNNAWFSVYLDHRKPSSGPHGPSFPHQLLMGLAFKLHIATLNVNHLDIESEEFSELSGKPGTLYVSNLQGTITNLTNMSEHIRKQSHTRVEASALFMHTIKARLGLDFDLAHYKNGNFGATLSATDFDPLVINPLAEPMGLFRVERGRVQELSARIKGNNAGAGGDVQFRYNKLRVSALEKDKRNPGELNKKHVTSVLANVLVVKDDNPAGSKAPRTATAQFKYNQRTSFFNLIWKTTFVGILDIVGAPRRLAE